MFPAIIKRFLAISSDLVEAFRMIHGLVAKASGNRNRGLLLLIFLFCLLYLIKFKFSERFVKRGAELCWILYLNHLFRPKFFIIISSVKHPLDAAILESIISLNALVAPHLQAVCEPHLDGPIGGKLL
jgi:hypothetical protein